jgi:hypothetical protein
MLAVAYPDVTHAYEIENHRAGAESVLFFSPVLAPPAYGDGPIKTGAPCVPRRHASATVVPESQNITCQIKSGRF